MKRVLVKMKNKNLESKIRTKEADFFERFETIGFFGTLILFFGFLLANIGYDTTKSILNKIKEPFLNQAYLTADVNKNNKTESEELYSLADALGIKVLKEGKYLPDSVIRGEISRSSAKKLKEYINKYKN